MKNIAAIQPTVKKCTKFMFFRCKGDGKNYKKCKTMMVYSPHCIRPSVVTTNHELFAAGYADKNITTTLCFVACRLSNPHPFNVRYATGKVHKTFCKEIQVPREEEKVKSLEAA